MDKEKPKCSKCDKVAVVIEQDAFLYCAQCWLVSHAKNSPQANPKPPGATLGT